MGVSLKGLAEQVIVITGASSGIGLATARMAARRGARLVLVSRNEAALRQLAAEIEGAGGQAAYAVADVGDEAAVRGITQAAVSRFGGFDTWVNDAGVGIYGDMLDIPTADSRKVFETNFWGVVYGSLEAARHLKDRGGAIINVGSEVSDRAVPQLGMYCASKHAVKGFTDALRMELEGRGYPISVSLVKPSATNTPFPDHAQNYMDCEPELPQPMYEPEVVAEVILHCCENQVRDIYAGGNARLNAAQGGLFPRLTDWVMEALMLDGMKKPTPPDHSDDNLYAPASALNERGKTTAPTRGPDISDRLAIRPLVTAAILGGAVIGVAAMAGAWGRRA